MFSIVIITKNEQSIIEKTLLSIQGLSNDIIIVDSGSTDNTIKICEQYNVTIIKTSWEGYGENKNKGIKAAKNDWILSIDADESVDATLKDSLMKLDFTSENIVYKINRRNFFLHKEIRYGSWGKDAPLRIFNRKTTLWNNANVHEGLLLPKEIKLLSIKGYLNHQTVSSIYEYIIKHMNYAKLNAIKYHNSGKKVGVVKLFLSPVFNFMLNFFFRLGFLDGWEGFLICKTNAVYTFYKYVFLRELNKKEQL